MHFRGAAYFQAVITCIEEAVEANPRFDVRDSPSTHNRHEVFALRETVDNRSRVASGKEAAAGDETMGVRVPSRSRHSMTYGETRIRSLTYSQ